MTFKRNYARECKEKFAELQKEYETINNYGWFKKLLFNQKKEALVEKMEIVLKIWEYAENQKVGVSKIQTCIT